MPAATCASAMRTRASLRQYGFSLLELLVALMVVILITSMVTLTVGSGGQDIRLESTVRNLADVASYALDEAQMTGQDFGLLLRQEYDAGTTQYSYHWFERRLDGWHAVESQDVFASQPLPEGIVLELELEDAPIAELSLDDDDEEAIVPQVVFYASGETTVGAIAVRQEDSGELLWRLEWDLLGRFELLHRGETEEDE